MRYVVFFMISSFFSHTGLALTPLHAYSDYVNTIDRGGFVFRGANVPHGMMMWGPTDSGYSVSALSGSEMNSGYTHDLPILPIVGKIEDSIKNGRPHRGASSDRVEPGYLNSVLASGVRAEFTTTLRSGTARFTYPTNLNHTSQRILISFDSETSAFKIENSNELSGFTERLGRRIYFSAIFDESFEQAENLKKWGAQGLSITFKDPNTPILMRMGISHVSEVNARENLMTENPDLDFDKVHHQARSAWDQNLSQIEIQGGKPEELKLFYTLFYQMLFHPNVFSDVNGEYMGFDSQVHLAVGYTHYANFSLWDTYRSWVPLHALLFSRQTSEMVRSLIEDGNQAGAMPRWPDDSIETGIMEAGSATPFVSQAYAFGARNFDLKNAVELMKRVETVPRTQCQGVEEHWGLLDYLNLGYLPVNMGEYLGRQTVSIGLEYGVGQFALSRMAREVGDTETVDASAKRAQNWRKLFNDRSGYLQPKNRDGSWWNGFDPVHGHMQGYTEGNATQYSWMVPYELRGLFDSMGGNTKVVARLDHFFEKLSAPNDGVGFNQPFSYIGNEPSFEIPWEYNWAQAPARTQAVVRKIITDVFMNGMPGADDLGSGSSFGIWAMLGLYPEVPGVGGLTIASPIFPSVILHSDSNKSITILAPEAAALNPYVQSLKINGREYTTPWVPLEVLDQNSILEFKLSTQPSGWGSRLQDIPPSFL